MRWFDLAFYSSSAFALATGAGIVGYGMLGAPVSMGSVLDRLPPMAGVARTVDTPPAPASAPSSLAAMEPPRPILERAPLPDLALTASARLDDTAAEGQSSLPVASLPPAGARPSSPKPVLAVSPPLPPVPSRKVAAGHGGGSELLASTGPGLQSKSAGIQEFNIDGGVKTPVRSGGPRRRHVEPGTEGASKGLFARLFSSDDSAPAQEPNR